MPKVKEFPGGPRLFGRLLLETSVNNMKMPQFYLRGEALSSNILNLSVLYTIAHGVCPSCSSMKHARLTIE
jgi:hypothetical protein